MMGLPLVHWDQGGGGGGGGRFVCGGGGGLERLCAASKVEGLMSACTLPSQVYLAGKF